MSHFTEIKTQIKDIEALRSACQEMGLTLLQNAEARGYYENKTKGDYVIRLKGPYDIALNKQPDGTFGLTADLWNGHVENEVGPGYGKLLQLYGVHKAMQEARKKGHLVRRSQQKDGAIKLTITA
jgi:Protein of unknown function (DUF1257)